MKIPDLANDAYEKLRTMQLDLVEQKCVALLAGSDHDQLLRAQVEGCSCIGVGHQDFSVKFWVGISPVRPPVEDYETPRFVRPEYTWQVWSHWAEFCPHIVARQRSATYTIYNLCKDDDE